MMELRIVPTDLMRLLLDVLVRLSVCMSVCLSVCLSVSIHLFCTSNLVHLVSKTANYIVYQFSIRPHGSYLEVQPV